MMCAVILLVSALMTQMGPTEALEKGIHNTESVLVPLAFDDEYNVTSPDGNIRIDFRLADVGELSDVPHFNVTYKGHKFLVDSRLLRSNTAQHLFGTDLTSPVSEGTA